MPHYTYFNIYYNDLDCETYYYVGSHKWDGPQGELDPSYHGSSGIVCPEDSFYWRNMSVGERLRLKEVPQHYHLVEEFLLSSRGSLTEEHNLIEFFCSLYGCSQEQSTDWSRQFRVGKMLNRHSFHASLSTYRKIADNRKRNGTYAHCTDQLNTPEARRKAWLAHDYSANAIKRLQNQAKRGTVSGGRHHVKLYYTNSLVFEGSYNAADKYTRSQGRRITQTWFSKVHASNKNGYDIVYVS